MTLLPIISLVSPLEVNDWFLSVILVALLLMLVLMAPYRSEYVDAMTSMFRFKTPDGDVRYPMLPTVEFILLFILSCISVGVTVSIYTQDIREDGISVVLFLLRFSLLAIVAFLLKLVLYTIVNKSLYRRQIISIQPGRWNCFFVMSFSVAGLQVLIFSVLVVLFEIPLVFLFVFSSVVRIMMISGRIFKIKTTLFKNKRSNSGFILYFCAFEIAPVLVEYVLLTQYFGLI